MTCRYKFLVLVATAALLLAFETAANAKRFALVIVSGDYDKAAWNKLGASIAPLPGMDTDANLMARLSTVELGIPREYIRLIGVSRSEFGGQGYGSVGENATYAVVVAELKRIVKVAKPGDYVMIYYSGHGSYLSDRTRASGQMDFIILRDGPLFPFEVYHILAPIRAKTTLVIDSCYSGGAARSAGNSVDAFGEAKYTNLIDEKPLRTLMAARKLRIGYMPNSPENFDQTSNISLMSASDKFNTAREELIPDYDGSPMKKMAGAFTLALYTAFFRRTGPLTYATAIEKAHEWLEKVGNNEIPQWNCPDPDAPAIAPTTVLAPYVPVVGARLEMGYLAGIANGSKWRSPNGGIYRITRADRFDSQISPVGDYSRYPNLLMPYLQPFPKEIRTSGGIPLNVAVISGSQPQQDQSISYGQTMQGGMQVNIVRQHNGKYAITASSLYGFTGTLATAPTFAKAQTMAAKVCDRLNAAGKLLDMLNSIGGGSLQLLGLALSTNHGDVSAKYHLGDRIPVIVESRHPGYLLLIATEPDGSVSVLFPNTEEKSVYLVGPRTFNIAAVSPEGVTQLTALLTTTPLVLPENLLHVRGTGYVSYIVDPGNVDEFISWLQEALSAHPSGSEDQHEFNSADVEEYSMSLIIKPH